MRIVASIGAALAAVTLSVAAASGRQASVVKEGGTFRVAVPLGVFDSMDPALYNRISSVMLGRPACGSLLGFPDKPLPEGLRLRPELADSEPVISRNGRTYTFTIRRDARFSDGTPVSARAFVRAIERVLTPAMDSPFAPAFQDVVGAKAMLDGKATSLSGAAASGRTLTVRLRKRTPDFALRTAGLCAVPPGLSADPEGAKAPLPSAAPYYVAEYVPGERLVLERNRFYHGSRPQHVDRITADLASDLSAVDRVASGEIEFYTAAFPRAAELARRYGVNKSQFLVTPVNGIGMFVLNTSRPLFRNNVKLRQAANFVVDRRALVREFPAHLVTATDQYLSPGTPGYRNASIYPLKGPEVRRAQELAAGQRRGGKAVLYTTTDPGDVARAQIIQQNFKAIGVEVEITQFPAQLLLAKLQTPGEPFDIARVGWVNSNADPAFIAFLFDGRTIGQTGSGNWSYFDSRTYNRLFEGASLLSGRERERAHGKLDIQISRDAAPAIPYVVNNNITFISAKVGCVVVNPYLDLTAVCFK